MVVSCYNLNTYIHRKWMQRERGIQMNLCMVINLSTLVIPVCMYVCMYAVCVCVSVSVCVVCARSLTHLLTYSLYQWHLDQSYIHSANILQYLVVHTELHDTTESRELSLHTSRDSYLHTYIHTYTLTYIHTYIHTHIHTYRIVCL